MSSRFERKLGLRLVEPGWNLGLATSSLEGEVAGSPEALARSAVSERGAIATRSRRTFVLILSLPLRVLTPKPGGFVLGERGHMLKVQVKKTGSIAILHLQGRIIRGETAVLQNAMNSQTEVSAVMLDLGGVNAIDAHGLGVMLQLREGTETKGIEFKLVNVTKNVRRILEITRLDSVFEINSKPDVPAASCFGLVVPMRQLACAPSA